ncbi:MAG: IS30 family transposase [Acidobacteriota bacterium]|nr:IS30 family transposase [Acidobacteriota bacterium]
MPRARQTYGTAERNELWHRWNRGDRITDIAIALKRETGSLYGHLLASGGIKPRKRARSDRVLSLVERESISRGLAAGQSLRSLARDLARSPSTISREVSRNGGRSRYRATRADACAWKAARRPKLCKLATRPRLRRRVASKLALNRSPEQIAGWLQRQYADDRDMRISHETIYRSLYIQARGVLKRELTRHLRTKRRFRRSARSKPSRQGQILDAVSIRERPPEIEDRAIPGHWEGDLLAGSRQTHIATLVERTSRYTILVKVPRKDAETVRKALARQIRRLPNELTRSLNWDRGTELAQHVQLSIDASLKIYFCDPQVPWQRGTNENTNRLLRQYFPKGNRLDGYSQADLNRTARELNTRPRKTLEFCTPLEVFTEALP